MTSKPSHPIALPPPPFEYKILSSERPMATEQQLTELGAEGWELCALIEWNATWYYYFKRKIRMEMLDD